MSSPSKSLLRGLVALAVAIPALVGLSAASAAPGPLAAVALTECTRGPAPEDRGGEFRGSMRRVAGTKRMKMRFGLQERVGSGAFSKVAAPGLGVWRTSRPGVKRFSYRQRVLALARGSSYRTVVHFRWRGAGGKLLRTARRVSGSCRQPGALPNLRVGAISARALKKRPGVVRYAVRVSNRGSAPAPETRLSLMVDGGAVDALPVPALAPGQVRELHVNGPECSSRVRATVDPDDLVRESAEADNSRAVACPAGS